MERAGARGSMNRVGREDYDVIVLQDERALYVADMQDPMNEHNIIVLYRGSLYESVKNKWKVVK